ncbi:MAG: hypothetical protein U9N84_12380, partial [Actinomycetota bacterium]|nr:hypothetical protein [Actinomycetota bacterium]
IEKGSGYFGIPALDPAAILVEEHSTIGPPPEVDRRLTHNGFFHRLENLAPGEGRAYRISSTAAAPLDTMSRRADKHPETDSQR